MVVVAVRLQGLGGGCVITTSGSAEVVVVVVITTSGSAEVVVVIVRLGCETILS